MNNEGSVGAATRQRVQEVIKELNYSPDPHARGLASKRSFLLALIYDNPNASFVTEAMYGSLDQCRPKGYELVMHPCNRKDEMLIDDVLGFIKRTKIDGVILLPPLSESEILVAALKRSNCHYVRLLSLAVDDPAHMIHFNDRQAVTKIAEHIIALGHREVGFIKGPDGSQSAEERHQSFRDALALGSIALPAHRVAKGDHT
ncbi:MAG: LacI family DNA-binding transcriptional regulator, partial [Candidatus Omnitrophica bacterium]|nr:LacI family DNA-binding transcriptional regulator [Candidatus Omnitrophota bacterium]